MIVVLPLALREWCPLLLPEEDEPAECVSGTRIPDPGVGLMSKPRLEFPIVDAGPLLVQPLVIRDGSSFFVPGKVQFPPFDGLGGSQTGIAKEKRYSTLKKSELLILLCSFQTNSRAGGRNP